MQNLEKYFGVVFIAFISIVLLSSCDKHEESSNNIEQGFTNPPDSVKPSVYWYWLSDNISETGVQKDIESMAAIGIGRAFIGNIGLLKEEVAYGNVKLFSDEWWRVTTAALQSATKHNIEIGLFNSPGWSQSGGPWIKDSLAMRYLGNTTVQVKGPLQYSKRLDSPPGSFQDVAVLAFPSQSTASGKFIVSSSPSVANIIYVVDNNFETAIQFQTDSKTTIDIQSAEVFTARSLTLYVSQKPFRADVTLQIKAGNSFTTVCQFEVDRSNPMPSVGFIPYAPVAIALPASSASDFRILLSNVQGEGGISEIQLSGSPVLDHYMEKQLAKMFQTPLPLWNEYQWPTQQENDVKLNIDPRKVINLSNNLSPDGVLTWDVPEGDWTIVRYGMIPTGVTNGPASNEGRGLEVDKMNTDALTYHFNSYIGKILERVSVADRKSLKWIVADSYETGSQNWTDGLAADFKKQYGYDPLPWLPVLTGKIVGTASQSDRFLWDLRRLVADQVSYKYVGGLRELSHKHGLKLWLENYGHWGFPGEFLQYGGQSDEVAGEFWNEGVLGSIECRAASSAAHIYGKTKVSAESFTAAGEAFLRHPGMLKKRGDWSFTEGINNTLLHVYITQPYEEKFPGVNAGFGTEFNRKNTWFYQGKAFVDYIRRCNFMLQQGKSVEDVAYFIGEDTPKMTGIREPALPVGYSYDYINAEVIMNRMAVKDGKLVLPDGTMYRLLVLPKLETMRPQLLLKIRELVNEGAVILGPAPKRSPSLKDYKHADSTIAANASAMWQNIDGKTITSATLGKGKIYNGVEVQAVLDELKVPADFKTSNESILYAHRTTAEGEVYFITNQSDKMVVANLTFRVNDRQPEWWDAVTGSKRDLPGFKSEKEVTTLPAKLEAYQSAFVVFRKPINGNTHDGQNFPEPKKILTIENKWEVIFDSTQRGPAKPILLDKLSDWSTLGDQLKYYSGTAWYKTNFAIRDIPKGESIYLNLGQVEVMAKVKINGKDVGTVWTSPFQLNVTDYIKVGQNDLEIEVVNTWVNRLIGDSKLPVEQRKTWSNVNPYKPDSPLDPAGLLGPVTLQAVKY